jgi:hypothetical protein
LDTAKKEGKRKEEIDADCGRIMRYRKRNGKEYYYIHWKDYPADDDTWEPKENISETALKVWERQSQERRKNDVQQGTA